MNVLKRNILIAGVLAIMMMGFSGPTIVDIISKNAVSLNEIDGLDSLSGYPDSRQDPDLVGYWKFDEGAGSSTSDETANNNDGTLDLGTVGTTELADAWVNGVSGGALFFDGKDDILNCGNHQSLDIDDEITIIAWVKCNFDFDRAMIGKHTSADYGYMLKWDREKGLLFAIDGNGPIYSRDSNLNTGIHRWYHLAATFKDDIHLYVDGTPADGAPHGNVPTGIGSSVADFTMGKRTDENYGFNGTLDEVKLFKRALTVDEIREDFARIARRGEWKLDDDTGNTAEDTSSYGNDGELYDAETGNEDGDTKPIWTTGIIDGALQFDGIDDHVEIDDDATLDFGKNDGLSVSAWVKTASKNGVIVGKRDDKTYYILWMKNGYLTGSISSNVDGSLDSTEITATAADGKVNDNSWHLVAMSVDPGSDTGLKLYVDGEEILEGDPTGVGDLSNSGPVNIGRDGWGESNYFSGLIDQAEIWEWSLTEREMIYNYDDVASVADIPPALAKEIPDTYSFPEDSVANDLINVTEYFSDMWDTPLDMSYSLESLKTYGHITATLVNYTISFAIDEINWTGNESFKVTAENTKGLTVDSNAFKVTVSNINDEPIWTGTPPSIEMDEDVTHISTYTLFDYVVDAESDPLEFVLLYPTDVMNITVNMTSGHINLESLMEDYHGDMVLNILVREVGSSRTSPTVDIPITVNSVNDVPEVVLLTPASGTSFSGGNITLSWKVTDVDDGMGNITFDVYFGKESSPSKFESHLRNTEFSVSNLDDMNTYYWNVIPSDRSDVGICKSGTWNFTVDSLLHLPKVELLTPASGVLLDTMDVNFTWKVTTNPGNKDLSFKVMIGPSSDNLSVIKSTKGKEYIAKGMEPNKNYFWTVIPYYGTDVEGICISDVWEFTIDDIPIYKMDAMLVQTLIKIVRGGSDKFNFSLTNTGNRMLDVTITARGNMSKFLEFNKTHRLSIGEKKLVDVNIITDETLDFKKYPLEFLIEYREMNKTLSLDIEIKENNVIPEIDKEPEKAGWMKWVLPVAGGVVLLIGILVLLVILMVRAKKKKEEQLAAEKEREDAEKKKREEEERARFQAQQEALAKDHGRWRRDDVDYDKFHEVSTEGWEETYMAEVKEEMKSAHKIQDMLAGAGTFTLGDDDKPAGPVFGSSLDVDLHADGVVFTPGPDTKPLQPETSQTPATTAAPGRAVTKPVSPTQGPSGPAQPTPGRMLPVGQPVPQSQSPQMRPAQSQPPMPPQTPPPQMRPSQSQPPTSPQTHPPQMRPAQSQPPASPQTPTPQMRPAQSQPPASPQTHPPQMRPAQSQPPASPQTHSPQMRPAQSQPPASPQKRPPVVVRPQVKSAEPKKEEKKGLDNVLKDLELDKW